MKKLLASILAVAMLMANVTAFAADEWEFIELSFLDGWGTNCFHQGYAPVNIDYKWHYIDLKGNIMQWGDFEYVFGFSEGLAAVVKNEKLGYIDLNGRTVIDFKYDLPHSMGMVYAGRFIDGKTVVARSASSEAQWGSLDQYEYTLINKNGDSLGTVSLDEAQKYMINDSQGSYYGNYVTIIMNGQAYDAALDEDATIITDYEANKSYIAKKKSAASSKAPEPSGWAKDAVFTASEYSLLDGWGNNRYQAAITREDFANLIVNCVAYVVGADADELTQGAASPFGDVDNVYVTAANKLGIVNGVGDGKFAPKKEITRQEIAVMIYRAIKYVQEHMDEVYMTDSTDLSRFTDAGKVADWARAAVATLAENEIMMGTGATTLSPLSNTTNEQAIVLAVRVVELIEPAY